MRQSIIHTALTGRLLLELDYRKPSLENKESVDQGQDFGSSPDNEFKELMLQLLAVEKSS